ncbi:hypothetical protein CK203_063076 [Vitis vinifera]|uniref:HAT C-terminal dimerisation domain-containing protein n=1 Tax=Vitis vinifera TaxID=29760 RepID=A0A438G612_VITVI|nr:hypothetical protein CK203_063076 [Vitis vinifera]
MKAEKQLMKKYNLYWTPCAAHCIDLIFEDMGKRPSVIEVINNARKITNFIYNHGWLLAQMRKYCGGTLFDWELQDAKRGFGDRATIAARSTMVPAEWWFMYGNQTPTLRKLAIKVLSQIASSSAYERNWSTFTLIHTRQRNRLAYPRMEQLVFCYYNMRLKLRDMEAENDQVTEKDYLDLLDITTEVGEEEDNQLFQWVRSIHLDDKVGNPDPRIAAHAREFGVNVERVLSEEVHSESFNKDIDDSLQAALNSHQEIDSTSVGHSSRPSAAGTSASGYDGSRGGTDDEDHGSRRANLGIGAIRKPYRGRERMMKPYNEELLSGSFESMSIGTQFSDSSNEANVYPPHVMSYGQPSSSTDEEYGMSRYSPSRQMPYQVPYQMEGGFGINTW